MPAPTAAPPAPSASAPAAPAAPAKSAAPAPKPAAPPKAAPAKAPPAAKVPTPPEPSKDDQFAEDFAELDALDRGEKPPARAPKQKPKPEKKAAEKPSAARAAEDDLDTEKAGSEQRPPEEDISDSGASTAPAEPSSSAIDEDQPVKAPELRAAFFGLKKKVAEEYEPQLKRLQSRLKEMEDGAPPKQFQEKFSALEARNKELEEHIKFVDFSKSKEYQEKFWQPYVKAWSNAIHELAGLQMQVENPDGGAPITREITEADLQWLAGLEPSKRRSEINRLFPDDKEEVKRHIGEISRLHDATQTALQQARENATAQSKEKELAAQTQIRERGEMWKQANTSLSEKYPQWFAPGENEEEGNSLLERGRAFADLVFAPQDLTPEQIDLLPTALRDSLKQNKTLSRQHMVKAFAVVRNKAANHDRMVFRLNAATQRIKELEESLKQYENSSPDNVPPSGGKPGATTKEFMDDASEELDQLDRKFSS